VNINLLTELAAGIPNGDYAVRIHGHHPATGAAMDLYYFTGHGDSYGYAITQAERQMVIAYELTQSLTDTLTVVNDVVSTVFDRVPGYELSVDKGNQFDAGFPNGLPQFTTTQENQ
jgi:hypothetical protein